MNKTLFVSSFLLISSNTFDDRKDKLKYKNDCTFENCVLKNNDDNTCSAFVSLNFNFDFSFIFLNAFCHPFLCLIICVHRNLKNYFFCSHLKNVMRNQLIKICLIDISNNIRKNVFVILKLKVDVYEI